MNKKTVKSSKHEGNQWEMTKHDKQMTGANDRGKWQDKKNNRFKWQNNDNPNNKINMFIYPSVWLQVPSKYMALLDPCMDLWSSVWKIWKSWQLVFRIHPKKMKLHVKFVALEGFDPLTAEPNPLGAATPRASNRPLKKHAHTREHTHAHAAHPKKKGGQTSPKIQHYSYIQFLMMTQSCMMMFTSVFVVSSTNSIIKHHCLEAAKIVADRKAPSSGPQVADFLEHFLRVNWPLPYAPWCWNMYQHLP